MNHSYTQTDSGLLVKPHHIDSDQMTTATEAFGMAPNGENTPAETGTARETRTATTEHHEATGTRSG